LDTEFVYNRAELKPALLLCLLLEKVVWVREGKIAMTDYVEEEFEQEEWSEQRPNRTGRRVGLIIACCIFLGLFGVVLGTGMFFANGLQPVDPQEEEVRVTVAPGMSSAKIAQLLEDQGLIRSEFVFRYYLRMKKEGSRFQAGEYLMKPGMELDEMITMM